MSEESTATQESSNSTGGGLLGGDSTQTSTGQGESKYGEGDWRSGLSQEWQGHSSIQDIKTQDDLVKSFVHAQSLVGADKSTIIMKPKEGATPEQIREYHSALGVPEKADDYHYDVSKLEGDQEALNGVVTDMKSTFHELGIPKETGEALMAKFFENQDGAKQAHLEHLQQDAAKSEENLKKDWADAYDQNIAIAKEALKQFDVSGELKNLLIANGLQSNEHFVKLFNEIGKRTLDSSVIMGVSGGSMKMAPAEAKAKLESMQADPEFVAKLMSNDRTVADAANKERTELFNIAYPG